MWEAFFKANFDQLTSHYPGLKLLRFLKEVSDLSHVSNLEDKLLEGVPFDYLRGWSEFYGVKLDINHHVLIPRPETEWLVDLIVRSSKSYESVLDVGVGSGAILLSLLKSKKAKKGVGVDVSLEALKVAQLNAQTNQLEATFIQSDRLDKISSTFDLIVSNPPYIKQEKHFHLVHPSVIKFEPHQALFLSDEIYAAWFEQLFRQVFTALNQSGDFYLEGHEETLPELETMLSSVGFSQVELMKDLSGTWRFLKATK